MMKMVTMMVAMMKTVTTLVAINENRGSTGSCI